jgi:hypothetical protein
LPDITKIITRFVLQKTWIKVNIRNPKFSISDAILSFKMLAFFPTLLIPTENVTTYILTRYSAP